MKAKFHVHMQLALIGAMALFAGDFVCLAQSAMAQWSNPSQYQTTPSTKRQSVKPQPAASGPQAPAGWLGNIPLYAPPGATTRSKPLPPKATSPQPADTKQVTPKAKAKQTTPKAKTTQATSTTKTTQPKPKTKATQTTSKTTTPQATGAQGQAVKAPAQTVQPTAKTAAPTSPAAAGQPPAKTPSPASLDAARPGNKELEGDINASFAPGGAGALPTPTPAAGVKAPVTPSIGTGAKSPTTAGTGPGTNIPSTGPTTPSVSVPQTPGPGAVPTSPVIQPMPVVQTPPKPGPLGYPTPPMPPAFQGGSQLPSDLSNVLKQVPPDLLRKAIPPGPYQETMRGTAPPVGKIYPTSEAVDDFKNQLGGDAYEVPGVPSPLRYADPNTAKANEEAVKQIIDYGYNKLPPSPAKTVVDTFKTLNKLSDDIINAGSLAPAGRAVQDYVNDTAVGAIADPLKDSVKKVTPGPVAYLVNKGVDKLADAAKDTVKNVEEALIKDVDKHKDEIFSGQQDFKAPGPAPPGPDGYQDTISPYLKK